MSSSQACCCSALCSELVSLGRVLCPLLCPWLPLTSNIKQDCEAAERKKEALERILEETEDIRKQKTDHCKYKYIMLRNGIKVQIEELMFFASVPIYSLETCSLYLVVVGVKLLSWNFCLYLLS